MDVLLNAGLITEELLETAEHLPPGYTFLLRGNMGNQSQSLCDLLSDGCFSFFVSYRQ
jgi:hypothetical protein